MAGFNTKASLGQRRSKLISKIIWLNRWYITHTMGSWYGDQRGGGGQLLTLMTITFITITHCLAGSMVLPDGELIYISPPLVIGGRRGMEHILNNCLKASESSALRRQHMYVQIVSTLARSKTKFESDTLRKTVHVLHMIWISHMEFSEIYIIIKSCFYIVYAINAELLMMKFWYFLCSLAYIFTYKFSKTHLNWG